MYLFGTLCAFCLFVCLSVVCLSVCLCVCLFVCVLVFVSVCCVFICQTEGLGRLRGHAQIGNADALEGQSVPLYLCLYFLFTINEMEHFVLS